MPSRNDMRLVRADLGMALKAELRALSIWIFRNTTLTTGWIQGGHAQMQMEPNSWVAAM